jgi:hypothetical protein
MNGGDPGAGGGGSAGPAAEALPDAYAEHVARVAQSPFLAAQALALPSSSARILDALIARKAKPSTPVSATASTAPAPATTPPAAQSHREVWKQLTTEGRKIEAAAYMQRHMTKIFGG